jgi:hypothetical protein
MRTTLFYTCVMGGWVEFAECLRAEITDEQARIVRTLRVDRQLTWRGVAEYFSDLVPNALYETKLRGNQIVGMFLCHAAAARLGEDPNAEPWN